MDTSKEIVHTKEKEKAKMEEVKEENFPKVGAKEEDIPRIDLRKHFWHRLLRLRFFRRNRRRTLRQLPDHFIRVLIVKVLPFRQPPMATRPLLTRARACSCGRTRARAQR